MNEEYSILKWKLKYGIDLREFPTYHAGGTFDEAYEFAYRNFMVDYTSMRPEFSDKDWYSTERTYLKHISNRNSNIEMAGYSFIDAVKNSKNIKEWKQLFINWLELAEEIYE
jgi:hypothetical protein